MIRTWPKTPRQNLRCNFADKRRYASPLLAARAAVRARARTEDQDIWPYLCQDPDHHYHIGHRSKKEEQDATS